MKLGEEDWDGSNEQKIALSSLTYLFAMDPFSNP